MLGSGLLSQPFIINEDISSELPDMAFGDAKWCDYDMDGDLDVLLSGFTAMGTQSILYINNGQYFSQHNFDFIPLTYSSVSWNDYNNNGHPDVFLAGKDDDDNPTGILYQNLGNDNFEEANTILLGYFDGESEWGDLDNDGDQDLVTIGNKGGEGATRIYRNDQSDNFYQITHEMTNVYEGGVDLGDYDNDKDLDILIIGYYKNQSGGVEKALKLYANNGNFEFSEIFSEFIGMSESSIRWADYDGDGDLDIIANGSTEAPTHLVYLYQNLGNDNFLNVGIEIFGTVNGSVDWGDYDNDGDLDFLLTGMPSYGDEPITEIYRNIAENLFNKEDSLNLPKVSHSTGLWCDYDLDGDLDVFIAGQLASGYFVSAVYTNKNDFSNGLPGIPDGLSAEVNENNVVLNWDPSTDPETSGSGLSYNLAVGTAPNAIDIVSPLSMDNGSRQIQHMGNAGHNVSAKLISLEPGTYYWKVQSVDNNFAGSGFSEEHQFVINPVYVDDMHANEDEVSISVYPNPFKDHFNIEIKGELKSTVLARFLTLEGKELPNMVHIQQRSDGKVCRWQSTERVNNCLPVGIYLLEITGFRKEGTEFVKVFKGITD